MAAISRQIDPYPLLWAIAGASLTVGHYVLLFSKVGLIYPSEGLNDPWYLISRVTPVFCSALIWQVTSHYWGRLSLGDVALSSAGVASMTVLLKYLTIAEMFLTLARLNDISLLTVAIFLFDLLLIGPLIWICSMGAFVVVIQGMKMTDSLCGSE